jgi:hypothetical protein
MSEVLSPVRHRIVVPLVPEDAFELFTRSIARWWPFKTHSRAGDDALDVQFEPRVGGAVTEVDRQGRRHAWGVRGAQADEQRGNYQRGWAFVLDRYAEEATKGERP